MVNTKRLLQEIMLNIIAKYAHQSDNIPDGYTRRLLYGHHGAKGYVVDYKEVEMDEKDYEGKPRYYFLDKAEEYIGGPRNRQYGDARENFYRISQILNAILEDKLKSKLTEEDVAQISIGIKLARLRHTPDHEDSWIDIAGYAALGGEVSCEE